MVRTFRSIIWFFLPLNMIDQFITVDAAGKTAVSNVYKTVSRRMLTCFYTIAG